MIRFPQPLRLLCNTLTALLVLSGCSSVDPLHKPVPLPDLKSNLLTKSTWSADIGKSGAYHFAPAAINNQLITVAANGKVTKLAAATGRIEWQTKIDGEISASPGTNGRIIAIATIKGKIFALNEQGQVFWEQTVADEVLSAPLVTDSAVIVRTLGNRVYAFDIENGKQRWLYQRAQVPLVLRAPLGMLIAGNTLIAGFPGGKLGTINIDNGSLVWEATLALAKGTSETERLTDITGKLAVRGKYVCAAAFQGRLGCFDLNTGAPLWSTEFSSTTGVVMSHDSVYAIDSKSIVSCFDTLTGKLKWRNDKLQWRNLGVPRLGDTSLSFGDSAGMVYLLSKSTGDLLGYAATDGSAIATAPTLLDKNLIVQTDNGRLHSFIEP